MVAVSTILPSSSLLRIKLFKHRPSQFHGSGVRYCHNVAAPPRCSLKATMVQFGEPEKLKVQLDVVKERLLESVPDSVKHFPWKEAEDKLRHRFILLGGKVLKWLIVTLFALSSISDFVFAVAMNKELMVPLGLLIGFSAANLFREILLEFSGNSEVGGYDDVRHLTTIGCIFLLVKLASLCLALRTRVFLLHVANGGLMQVLWLWRNSSISTTDEEKSSVQEDAQASAAIGGGH
ncbi:hypothetical protein SAY87_011964 [Trapa incisa]|uniref:Uncharacterized protein n=1 Tax=Trapa incisa TaxID=236973 RepID=A0AAN7GSP0_9MYRT|nr:hypothetical protein SAY87_011964 [Trapa incisa]